MKKLLFVGAVAVFISPAFFINPPPPKTPEQLSAEKAFMLAERRAMSTKCVQAATATRLGDAAIIRETLKCMRDNHQEGY